MTECMNQKKNRAPSEASSSLNPDASRSLLSNVITLFRCVGSKAIHLPINKRKYENYNVHPREQVQLFCSIFASQLQVTLITSLVKMIATPFLILWLDRKYLSNA